MSATPRALPALAEISDHYPGRLTAIEGDALKTDFEALAKDADGPMHIIANLPYNVGTQLLVNWLLPASWPPFYASMTLMFQREVGLRIVAGPDDDHYGRLGVLAGWRTEARMAFDVPPQAFTPPPKVTSTVVHLTPIENPIPCDPAKLEKVTAAAFGQRRKMLRQSVKSIGGRRCWRAQRSIRSGGRRRCRWRSFAGWRGVCERNPLASCVQCNPAAGCDAESVAEVPREMRLV